MFAPTAGSGSEREVSALFRSLSRNLSERGEGGLHSSPLPPLAQMEDLFRQAVQSALVRLSDAGLGHAQAVDLVLSALGGPSGGKSVPEGSEVDELLRTYSFSCRQDAVRALVVSREMKYLREQGLSAGDAIRTLILRVENTPVPPPAYDHFRGQAVPQYGMSAPAAGTAVPTKAKQGETQSQQHTRAACGDCSSTLSADEKADSGRKRSVVCVHAPLSSMENLSGGVGRHRFAGRSVGVNHFCSSMGDSICMGARRKRDRERMLGIGKVAAEFDDVGMDMDCEDGDQEENFKRVRLEYTTHSHGGHCTVCKRPRDERGAAAGRDHFKRSRQL